MTYRDLDADKTLTHFLIHSAEHRVSVIEWLERINPPYLVWTIPLDREVKGMNVYWIAAVNGQTWGMFMVEQEDLDEFARQGLGRYLDSKMRWPYRWRDNADLS